MQRVEKSEGVMLTPMVSTIFGSFERKEGFKEFVELCRRPGGREFVEEVLGFDESKTNTPYSSSASTSGTAPSKRNSYMGHHKPNNIGNPDAKFFKRSPPIFPPELNFARLLKLLTQSRSSRRQDSGAGTAAATLTPQQVEEMLVGDELTRNPRYAWPLQVLTLCTSFYLTCLKYGFDVVSIMMMQRVCKAYSSGKGFLAALAVSAACAEVDAVIAELTAVGNTELLAVSSFPLSPPYFEDFKQSIQLRVCKALVRAASKYSRVAALVGLTYEQHLDRGLGYEFFGHVPSVVDRPDEIASPSASEDLPRTSTNKPPATSTNTGIIGVYCCPAYQMSFRSTSATSPSGGSNTPSNISFTSVPEAFDSDDESSLSLGGSSDTTRRQSLASEDSDASGGDSPTASTSSVTSPMQAGLKAALRKRFFGTKEFSGMQIGDPSAAPANPVATGTVVSLLIINTPIYVLRILVDECNQPHQWRGRNPFVPPPITHSMRVSPSAGRADQLGRYLGEIGDVVAHGPVVISRTITFRTAEVSGHPVDILRLEAMLAAFCGIHTGSKIHRDPLPKAAPELNAHYNASLPSQLLTAFRDCQLQINKTDLAVTCVCPVTGCDMPGDPNTFLFELAHILTCRKHDLRRARIAADEMVSQGPNSEPAWGLVGYHIALDFSPSRISIGKIASWEAGGSMGVISLPDDVFHPPNSLLPPLKRSGREDILRKTLRQLAILNSVLGSIWWFNRNCGHNNKPPCVSSLTTTFAEMGLLIPTTSLELPMCVLDASKASAAAAAAGSSCVPPSIFSGPTSPVTNSDDMTLPLPATLLPGLNRRSSASPSRSHYPQVGSGSHFPPMQQSIKQHHLSDPTMAAFLAPSPHDELVEGGSFSSFVGGSLVTTRISDTDMQMLPHSTPWRKDAAHTTIIPLQLGGVSRHAPMFAAGGGYVPSLSPDDVLLSRGYCMPRYQDNRTVDPLREGYGSSLNSPTSSSGRQQHNKGNPIYDLSDVVRITGPCLDADVSEATTRHLLTLAAVEVARRLSLVTGLEFPPHCLLFCWNVYGLLELWDVMLFRSTLLETGLLMQ